MPTSPTIDPAPATPAQRAPGSRIAALDVLRGFALCGILFVNIQPIARWSYDAPFNGSQREPDLLAYLIGLGITERMFPLFALLFGMGFALFLESAAGRTAQPRLVLLRRLAFLLVIGVLHLLVYPGEVLASYAAAGIVVLLPSSFMPRWLVAGAGVLLTVAAAPIGAQALLPGLFLLGAAIIRYRVLDIVAARPRFLVAFFAVTLAGAVGTGAWLATDILSAGFGPASSISGLLTMFALASGVLLLMQSARAAKVLKAVFAPLGRMALTNYLSATVILVLASLVFDLSVAQWEPVYAVLVALVVLPIQWLASWLWLRRFRFGPAEWVWRTVTWWAPQPLRRSTVAARYRRGGHPRS